MCGACSFSTHTAVALAVLWFSSLAAAHSGGLNAEGCHNDRKRGEYHCHDAPVNRVQTPSALLRGKNTANCGTKRYCKQMVSCAEAVHYLYNCGITRLDGDRDGIPCEKLCGNGKAGINRVEQLLRGGK